MNIKTLSVSLKPRYRLFFLEAVLKKYETDLQYTISWIITLKLHLDFTSFMLYPLTGKERGEIAECLIHYLSYHLDIRLDIKSLSVLRELFSD